MYCSIKSTLFDTENNNITWLSSFEYVITWTPVDEGTDGIWSSIPPTTYILTTNQHDMTYIVNEHLISNISHKFTHTTIRRTVGISDK